MLERPAREGVGLLKEFRQFILRGNLVDLAVAVVIGTAFTALVTSLVKNLVTPLIAAIAGEPDFSDLTFKIHGSRFLYGAFLNALISFLIIAAVVFFLIIKPVNVLMERFAPDTAVDVTTRGCPECLSDIPLAATRCAFCTARVPAVTAPDPAPTEPAPPKPG
ncbi:MAG: large conductance mechanosensitive channel [Solirubrobacteraceae bacterium]|jgi:large conductance mechanosensitive channel|nr:large conductance mechanosensitive channel [Solirubrobacteraceae bacterium]